MASKTISIRDDVYKLLKDAKREEESFSDAEVWEEYESISGCQQAAHRAKLCWAAMVKAAPKYDANKQLS